MSRVVRRKLPEKPTSPQAAQSPTALAIRSNLQVSQGLFARLIPVSVRSLATLESGTPPTPAVSRRLTELQRLIDALAEVIRRDALGSWLQNPNEAFGGLKPFEVIERGESDRVWAMIYFLRAGVPS